MGGEGTILLLFRPGAPTEAEVLDPALPPDHGDGLANGGWFAGPGGWLLLIEGMPDQIEPWLQDVAARLDAAGLTGELTGAPRAREPRWSKAVDRIRPLTASIGFRVLPGHSPYGGWGGVDGSRTAALDAAMAWLTEHDGQIMVHGDMDSRFWTDPEQARRILQAADTQRGPQWIEAYLQPRAEVRSALMRNNGRLELTSVVDETSWSGRVTVLRQALQSLSVGSVTVAIISHRNWSDLVITSFEGTDYYHPMAYEWHPELWGEYLIDASGIQIVTDQHLEKAADLSAWSLTRLDDSHHLLEAPDLEPWFDEPSRVGARALPEVIHQARRDFGDMILTRQRAEQLQITEKPPNPNLK